MGFQMQYSCRSYGYGLFARPLLNVYNKHRHARERVENCTDAQGVEHKSNTHRCTHHYDIFLLQDHLVGIHLLASNLLATSTAQNLNASHPIRRMLRPHTYSAISVNLGAINTLLPDRGVLHRTVALTWQGLQHAYSKSVELLRIHWRRSAWTDFGALCCVACELAECIHIDFLVCRDYCTWPRVFLPA